MTEWTDDDLARFVEVVFAPADRAAALTLVGTYGTQSFEREAPRVRRVLLQSCEGSLDRLQRLVTMAKVDYRDILVRDPGADAARP